MVSPASESCQFNAGCPSAVSQQLSGLPSWLELNGFPAWPGGDYHVPVVGPRQDRTADIQGAGESVLQDAAARLRELLAELAQRLRPFPAFLNMASVQAVELEPSFAPPSDRGCVVVLPGGEISEMALSVMPGIQGIMDIDQVEQFTELELPSEEYIVYAVTAIRVLAEELARRGFH